ncbi:indolepyruvate ferredoxin oxidoreductase family protein [Novosphingobium sp.]|uniref:indolepyruvate ferredoxin oxidoreductase family protein n=1 Tax=Novosphingobium sp. TaxID=1874826 RepID=UPI00286DF24E|nr:indolepyruvate ferredoxin oxidoreductase family protein [Novosphingobium sp.]
MTKHVVSLDDKFLQGEGQVTLSSLQAVVRLLLDQARRDASAGLKTAGYVTGYRGSPITTLDAQLWAAEKLLTAHDIRFEPGLNEELAATALRGTQQIDWYGKPRVDGVFSLWYAKGVGVDRACEAIKQANFEGTAAKGGGLILAGDDHAAKSSLTAHQSEHTLIAGFVPALYPATTEDLLRLGQLAIAMSRASGLFIGIKAVTDTLDLTSTVTLPGTDFPIIMPDAPSGVRLNLWQGMTALQQEALVVDHRLPMAQAFARANAIDRITHGRAGARLVIATAGKAWLDVSQALDDLGLDAARCEALGLAVAKFGMVWPLEPHFAREACLGAEEVLVVEEKRPVIEEQLAHTFYGEAKAPRLTGKTDGEGRPLLSSVGVLDPGSVRRALVQRLEALGMADADLRDRHAALTALEDGAKGLSLTASRPAYFCSGCPHNTSTLVPEGSAAMGATGCHGLAHYMPSRNTMQTVGMGGEGMPWLAAQHFVDAPHMFQNLGDGTYTHSGLLAIRASVAAKSRVTYKILYNDAVAMTGGQPAEGALTPEQIVCELVVEGVHPVVLVSDDPERFKAADLPPGQRVLHRDHLDEVQRELREVPGTSAIVYDQVCANEKRRRRKRGLAPDPDHRLFINPAVCEGCGDCSTQSNCLSIEPVETEFGRKRAIDQSSCNKDYSCIKGFCPSFVSVRGAKIARHGFDRDELARRVTELPVPTVIDVSAAPHAMLVTGIGGTGVLTVGALLAMAAQLEGKAAKVLDMTGMAQKGGAVTSHVRIAEFAEAIPSARLRAGQADLVIGCDLVVASAPDVLTMARGDTRLLANADVQPTGEFQTNRDLDLSSARFLAAIGKRIAPEGIFTLRASSLATRLCGDSIYTNLMMLGFAAQQGLLPVGIEAVEAAIGLNGVKVQDNLDAFAMGRLAAVDPQALFALAGDRLERAGEPKTLAAMIESRSRHLTAWQDAALAARYCSDIEQLDAALAAKGTSDREPFLIEAARQLARLIAYKDEYEVARLYTAPEFRAALGDRFGGAPTLQVWLAPPLLPLGKDARTGRPRKIAFGGWIFPLFRVLAAMKGLRGRWCDPFGHTAERRMERALAGEYLAMLHAAIVSLSPAKLALAVELAASPREVAGFGEVKEAGVSRWREQAAALMERLAD